jgi:rRNA processing protein Gar1
MGTVKNLTEKGIKAVRKVYQKAETEFLVAQGRKAVKEKTKFAVTTTKKAARAGLVAGVITSAAVVYGAVKRRKARKA